MNTTTLIAVILMLLVAVFSFTNTAPVVTGCIAIAAAGIAASGLRSSRR